MKKLILALTLITFAVASYAGGAKPAKKTKEDASCCAKTETVAKAKSKDDCSSCCKEKRQAKLMSPKAAAEMGK